MRVFDLLILCTEDQIIYIVEEGTDKILEVQQGIKRLSGFYNAHRVRKIRGDKDAIRVYV